MPVYRHASGTRMLMGSIASGDDGGGAGCWNGMRHSRWATVTERLEGEPPRRAGLSRFVLRHSTRRLYANACFSTRRCPGWARWTLRVVTGRLSVRKYRCALSVAVEASKESGFRPKGRSTRHRDTGSALPIRARLIRRSRHFRPLYWCPARVRCAASKSLGKPSLYER